MAKRPTAQELADYFGLSRVTINSYRNGNLYQQRRYYAMLEYYERQHRPWEIDYRTGVGTHPNIVVKISEEPSAPVPIGEKMVALGFDKQDGDGVRHFFVTPLDIDKGLWVQAERDDGRTLSRLMSELGDAFSLDDWDAART